MTKWEWESALKRHLARLSEAEQERALGYYQELFADKAEAGMSETRIIEQFGNPAEVAEKILAEYQYELHTPPFDAQPVKDRPQAETMTADEPPQKTAKRDIFGFDVGTASVYKPGTPICKIDVQTEGKVTVVRGDTLQIEYYESDYYRYDFECKDGVLKVKFAEVRALPKLIFFGLTACGFEKLALKIVLPPDRVDLYIDTKNGKVRVTDGPFGTLDVRSKNAAIAVESVEAENLQAETANGGIAIKRVKAGAGNIGTRNGAIDVLDAGFSRLHVHTTNASVHINRTNAAGLLSAGSTNGRLTLEHVHAEAVEAFTTNAGIALDELMARLVNAGTTNGGIAVERLEASDITLKTTNGSIRGSICGKKADFSITSHNKMGENDLIPGGEGASKLNVSTTMGSIKLRFTEGM